METGTIERARDREFPVTWTGSVETFSLLSRLVRGQGGQYMVLLRRIPQAQAKDDDTIPRQASSSHNSEVTLEYPNR